MDKNQLMMQVLVLALANLPTMTIVAIGILYNNSRLSDLRAQMESNTKMILALMDANAKVVDSRFAAMDEKLLRVEQILDARLTRIEEQLGIKP